MNCFRHPTEAAAVFCKGCGKALCLECCGKTLAGQTHVCSEACAHTASQRTAVAEREQREGRFDQVYAAVFLTVFLALLGGGFAVWTIKSDIATEEYSARMDAASRRTHFIGAHYYRVKCFYALGLTTWNPQFGLGATVGAVCAVLFLKGSRKIGRNPVA